MAGTEEAFLDVSADDAYDYGQNFELKPTKNGGMAEPLKKSRVDTQVEGYATRKRNLCLAVGVSLGIFAAVLVAALVVLALGPADQPSAKAQASDSALPPVAPTVLLDDVAQEGPDLTQDEVPNQADLRPDVQRPLAETADPASTDPASDAVEDTDARGPKAPAAEAVDPATQSPAVVDDYAEAFDDADPTGPSAEDDHYHSEHTATQSPPVVAYDVDDDVYNDVAFNDVAYYGGNPASDNEAVEDAAYYDDEVVEETSEVASAAKVSVQSLGAGVVEESGVGGAEVDVHSPSRPGPAVVKTAVGQPDSEPALPDSQTDPADSVLFH